MKSTSISRKPTNKATGEGVRRLEIILQEIRIELEQLKTRITALGG